MQNWLLLFIVAIQFSQAQSPQGPSREKSIQTWIRGNPANKNSGNDPDVIRAQALSNNGWLANMIDSGTFHAY